MVLSDGLQPQFVTIDGARIRYATSTKVTGVHSAQVSLARAHRRVLRTLAEVADVAPLVAIDLPGFGRSDGRPDVMTPQSMRDFLIKVVSTFARGLSTKHPHARRLSMPLARSLPNEHDEARRPIGNA